MHPPHSCGDVCGRSRGPGCPHLCPQQCHPGACPACTSMAPMQKCFCGQTSYQPLCKDRHLRRSCENICGKTLNCGNHACLSKCHEDQCSDCEYSFVQDCFCGKESLSLKCGSKPSCENKCNRILSCGKHFCDKKCHEGDCGVCQLSPDLITHCPCGKNPLDMILLNPRSSCCDPIPSCFGACNKILDCGHKCSIVCHSGPCPPCKSTQNVSCRCTRTSQDVRCQDLGKMILCNKQCNTKKSCKKHKCNSVCCLGYEDSYSDEHRCLEMCGKILNCGLHTCISHCHIGNCEPCKVITRTRVYCPCGKSFKDPPLKCGTKDMEIGCTFKCNKVLSCGHACSSICHAEDCPKCCQLVEKVCKCGKMYLPMSCGINTVSCGKICGKVLECGHSCTEKCHSGDCKEFVKPHLCANKKEKCSHTCLLNCHFPEPCPLGVCKVKVTVYCKCKSRSINSLCENSEVLECNDDCVKALRDKAFGTLEIKELYSEELVEFGKSNFDFVRKAEAKLEKIIQNKEKVTFLPPMKEKQRWLYHELANNHYKFETESLDKEPYRSVYIYLNDEVRIPTPLLSEFISLVNQGIETEFEKKECLASLLFYQLSSYVTTDNLNEVLQKFAGDFYIKWENDHSAYAHFFSLHKCMEAKKMLEKIPGQYSVLKMVSNTKQDDTTGFKKVFRNTRKAQEVKSFDDEKEEVKTQEPLPIKKVLDNKPAEIKKGSIFNELLND